MEKINEDTAIREDTGSRIRVSNKTEEVSEHSFRQNWKEVQLKKDFSYNSSYSMPWIDRDLYSWISHSNPRSLYSGTRIPSRSETQISDKASLEKYTSGCRHLPRYVINLLWHASIAASSHLGLIDEEFRHGKRFSTLDPSLCLEYAINDANAGYPTYRKKNSKRAKNDAFKWLNTILNKPSVYSFFNNILLKNPKILMHRFQPKLKDGIFETKVRQVWCESFRIILLENYFFRNLINSGIEYNQKGVDVSSSSGLRNVEISQYLVARLRNLWF
jgi:hypothetical protein